jgi:hypothetical protein
MPVTGLSAGAKSWRNGSGTDRGQPRARAFGGGLGQQGPDAEGGRRTPCPGLDLGKNLGSHAPEYLAYSLAIWPAHPREDLDGRWCPALSLGRLGHAAHLRALAETLL